MKITGKLIAKYEVIGKSKNMRQKIAVKANDGNVVFIHTWGEKLIRVLSFFNIGESVIVDYNSYGKEAPNGKVYINHSLNFISRQQLLELEDKKSNFDFEEFYLKANAKSREMVDITYEQLLKKHDCNIDRFEFFYQIVQYLHKYGEKKLNTKYLELLSLSPSRITNSNLEREMFGNDYFETLKKSDKV